ncbi:tetraspanin-1 [Channa argus]|uniref:tetraspanin-1 n=1 Tax=Channa argus TaxID=215402 RepID=UPI003522B82E
MGCFTFVTLMMVMFNLLIFLCGMTLMAVGTVVGVNRSSLLQLLGPFSSQSVQFINVGFFCIAIGALLLVLLGLLGFCGAHKESRCLLLTFSSIILIMFFAEVAAAVLRCCGFTNYTDFVGSTFEKENGGVLPSSCCRTNSTTCSRDDAALSGVQGCCKLILQIIKDHGNIMGSVAAGIGLLEVK